jgi:hypothetical protein
VIIPAAPITNALPSRGRRRAGLPPYGRNVRAGRVGPAGHSGGQVGRAGVRAELGRHRGGRSSAVVPRRQFPTGLHRETEKLGDSLQAHFPLE